MRNYDGSFFFYIQSSTENQWIILFQRLHKIEEKPKTPQIGNFALNLAFEYK